MMTEMMEMLIRAQWKVFVVVESCWATLFARRSVDGMGDGEVSMTM